MTSDQTAPCGGKIRFTRKQDAQFRASRMRDKDKIVAPYRCAECGGWHIGGTRWTRRGVKRPVRRVICMGVGGWGERGV
ncbi:hypothetical protein GOB93_14220 [Acetobacter musti]|uniref:Uncharacterized protein n=1 Tax=Acetobacter musti TaxID=864732 RepID=A0ABX0JUV6_9PROT|nr:hypothetical protein [Acetobacter musti]NHN85788.1 hypothetical protein [Acetobacter musti]